MDSLKLLQRLKSKHFKDAKQGLNPDKDSKKQIQRKNTPCSRSKSQCPEINKPKPHEPNIDAIRERIWPAKEKKN